MFQAQVRIHLLQAAVLLFQLFHPLHFADAHPAVLGFPLVKRSFAEPVLAAQIFHRYPASASFKMFTIWLSENLDFFMARAPGSILPRSVYFSLVLFYGRVTILLLPNGILLHRVSKLCTDKLSHVSRALAIDEYHHLLPQPA